MQSRDTKTVKMSQTVMPQVVQGGSTMRGGQTSLTTTTQVTPQAAEAVLLPRSISSCLKTIFASDGSFQSIAITPMAKLPEADRQKAIQALEAWAQPLPEDNILVLISELRLTTTAKKLPYDDLIAQTLIYADKLKKYPAAVVFHVLKTQPDIDKWWPEWAVLKERIGIYSRKNNAALDALRNYADPVADKKRERVTPDQMKAIRDKINASNIVNGQ